MDNDARLLRLPEVIQLTGLGRSAIYERMGRKEFPQSVPLTATSVAWVESEVRAWIAERIAQRDAQRDAERNAERDAA